MTLRYTTVKGFWDFLGITSSIPEFSVGATPAKETVATETVAEGDYYLDHANVNEDTLKLYADTTELTPTTHYTFDSNTSKVTITAAGATALTGEDLTAEYEFAEEGNTNYNQAVALLERMESRFDNATNTVFADQTATDPSYKKVVDSVLKGQGSHYKTYVLDSYPIIKLQTTVNGAYTTGGTEITLASATGFPNSGTIYIGGNKVTYTGKTSNTLTIPATTPSISDGSLVRGEVIEISSASSAEVPTFVVLTPQKDYEINYETGEVQLLDTYYFTDTNLSASYGVNDMPPYGIEGRFRASFFTAWRDTNDIAKIPDDIVECIYMMAGRQLSQRTVTKSIVGQRDNFDPQSFGFSKVDIDETISKYKIFLSGRA